MMKKRAREVTEMIFSLLLLLFFCFLDWEGKKYNKKAILPPRNNKSLELTYL